MLLLALRVPIVVAATLVLRLSLRSRSWTPIAVGLWCALAKDLLLDLLELPARWELAAWLSTPLVSAWTGARVLGGVRPDRARAHAAAVYYVVLWFVLCAPSPASWWAHAHSAALVASLAVQLWALAAWLRSRRVGTTADAAAIVLLAGDAALLVGPAGLVPGPWRIVVAQTSVTACGVIALALSRW